MAGRKYRNVKDTFFLNSIYVEIILKTFIRLSDKEKKYSHTKNVELITYEAYIQENFVI